MKTMELEQGSKLWLEHRRTHRNASDTPSVTGHSPYKSRSKFMHEWVTGIIEDVDDATQARFADGHRSERLARPLMAQIIGEDLSPVVGVSGVWSASFDGLTFDEMIAAEHKALNDTLRAVSCAAELPIYYREQMEHQLMVCGGEKCLFMASRWNANDTLAEEVHFWYEPDLALRARIIAEWEQFVKDAETHVPPEIVPEVIAAPIKDLPAITYKMEGMHLSTNLRNDVKPAILALVEQSKRKLETDQDFSDLDALCKKFKLAELQCELVQVQAVGEIKDVDAFCRDLKELSEIMRQARIAGEKAVTSEKESRKLSIIITAKSAYTMHIAALETEIKPIVLQVAMPDFAGAMKGLKKLSAMQEAVDNALRDGKMLADSVAQDIRRKLEWFRASSSEHQMLFPDLAQIITKQADDFKLLVTTRIDKHKADEAAKIERIRMEEEAKARAKIEAEAKAKAEQEAAAHRERNNEAMKWKLVPETPTKEMHEAGSDVGYGIGGSPPSCTCVYEAMLAAAPQPESDHMTKEEAQAKQDWNGMDGAIAFHLIERHADGWNQIGRMMDAWLEANRVPNVQIEARPAFGASLSNAVLDTGKEDTP